MARIDNLSGGELADLKRRIAALEKATPLASASITRGRLRVASTEGLVVEGSAKVSGTLNVSGILTGLGSFLWNGIVTLTSTFTSNGPWNLNGAGTITGNSTQTGDMTVNGGGKIVIAGSVPMTLGITSNGKPGAEFSGGRMSSDGSRIALESGSATVGAASTFASISFGSSAVVAQSDSVYLFNLPTSTNAPNLYWSSATGKLYRSTAAGSPA